MQAKKILTRYRRLTFIASRDEERIKQIEDTLLKGMEMDGQPKGTKTGDPTGRNAVMLAELRSKIERELIEAEVERQKTIDLIHKMEDPVCQELLYSRYILGLTWERVTDRLDAYKEDGYTVEYVMGRMHARALRLFEEVI